MVNLEKHMNSGFFKCNWKNSFNKEAINNNFIKIKGKRFFRVISCLVESDIYDELNSLKLKGLEFRYKIIHKTLGNVNPIVAHHLYVDNIELCSFNR